MPRMTRRANREGPAQTHRAQPRDTRRVSSWPRPRATARRVGALQQCQTASTPRVGGPAAIPPDQCRSRATSATRAASVALSAAAAASRRLMVCRSAAHAAEVDAMSSGAASSARIDGRSPNGRTAHSVDQCSEAPASAQYEAAGRLGSGSTPRCALPPRVHPSARPRVPPRAPSVPERACVPDDGGLACADDATI
jgi:hypothetical protein